MKDFLNSLSNEETKQTLLPFKGKFQEQTDEEIRNTGINLQTDTKLANPVSVELPPDTMCFKPTGQELFCIATGCPPLPQLKQLKGSERGRISRESSSENPEGCALNHAVCHQSTNFPL